MLLTDHISFYAATDVGKEREHNEDNYLVDKKLSLFIVADGMGGHAAGEVASALAVRVVHEEMRREKRLLEEYASQFDGKISRKDIVALLEHAVQRACLQIHAEAEKDAAKRGMGTTLTALLLVGHQGFIAHVGDSRLYMQRGGKIQQITEDHTVLNELIKRGKLSKEQIDRISHKHAITRAVGVYERVEVDMLVIDVLPGDTFVLASDGLTGYVDSPSDLTPHLVHEGEAAAKSLIGWALERGGKDNITSIVIRVGHPAEKDETRALRLQHKADVLAKTPIFSRLNERERMRVMQALEERKYQREEKVLQEGERSDPLFIVLSGQFRVSRGGTTLTQLGVADHFGEMALIRNAPRAATVTALDSGELLVLPRENFFEILRKEHEIGVKVLWQLLGILASRLDQASNQLHQVRNELSAQDITPEIFPDMELEPEELSVQIV